MRVKVRLKVPFGSFGMPELTCWVPSYAITGPGGPMGKAPGPSISSPGPGPGTMSAGEGLPLLNVTVWGAGFIDHRQVTVSPTRMVNGLGAKPCMITPFVGSTALTCTSHCCAAPCAATGWAPAPASAASSAVSANATATANAG